MTTLARRALLTTTLLLSPGMAGAQTGQTGTTALPAQTTLTLRSGELALPYLEGATAVRSVRTFTGVGVVYRGSVADALQRYTQALVTGGFTAVDPSAPAGAETGAADTEGTGETAETTETTETTGTTDAATGTTGTAGGTTGTGTTGAAGTAATGTTGATGTATGATGTTGTATGATGTATGGTAGTTGTTGATGTATGATGTGTTGATGTATGATGTDTTGTGTADTAGTGTTEETGTTDTTGTTGTAGTTDTAGITTTGTTALTRPEVGNGGPVQTFERNRERVQLRVYESMGHTVVLISRISAPGTTTTGS